MSGKDIDNNHLQQARDEGGTECGTVGGDLTLLAAVWPSLPASIRDAILDLAGVESGPSDDK